MKTKEEVIKEAWIELMTEDDFNKIRTDENGFSNYQCRRFINQYNWDKLYSRIKSGGKTGNDIIYRPKSLQGIENNNGWTRIEPDGSNLPADKTLNYKMYVQGLNRVFEGFYDDCWCYKSDGSIYELKGVTHYKPIQEDKPPIY